MANEGRLIDPSEAGSKRDGSQVDVPMTILAKWQTIVDTMAELVETPAGLIMSLEGDCIKVCASSRSQGNPYHVGEADVWEASGLYCETVVKRQQRLLVPDASADVDWSANPDVPRGMISYLGYPIRWPDGQPFGTICVLDSKPNAYNERYERLIEQFREIVEHHLALIWRDFDRQMTARSDRARHADALARSRRELREARAELMRASRLSEIGYFAGAVIHEINQPLAAMATSATACLRWLEREEPDVPEACKGLQRLVAASRQVAEVVGGLRSLALEAPIAPGQFDLSQVVLETVAMFREQLDRDGVREEVVFGEAASKVFGERVQVQLVLHNLLRNAIESMAGVDRRGRLSVSVTRLGDELTVCVDDNGVGLEPEIAKRILRSAFTTKSAGMGIGLTICRSIIEAHGGTLAATPNPHEPGARLTFSLPCKSPIAPEVASPSLPPASRA